MNLVGKLREEFTLPKGVFYYDTQPKDSIVVYYNEWNKWKEIKESRQLKHTRVARYFEEWLFWKYPEEMEKIKCIKYKEEYGRVKYKTTYL